MPKNEHFMVKTVQETTHARSWRFSTTRALRATFFIEGEGGPKSFLITTFKDFYVFLNVWHIFYFSLFGNLFVSHFKSFLFIELF
jgi:hypothetical protein